MRASTRSPSSTTRQATGCAGRRFTTMPRKPPPMSGARRRYLPGVLRRPGGLRLRRTRTRSSSSGCPARARRCWSRSWPAIPLWRARWSCRTSPRWPGRWAARRARADESQYPEILAGLGAGEMPRLGEQYLARDPDPAQDQRAVLHRQDAQQLRAPWPDSSCTAKCQIIDARRHPWACCFSGFKQHFARGQNFTYSLEEIGRYYRDYVELMAHFDAVLPGRVHRVFYESMC